MNREIVPLAFVGGLGDILSQIFQSDPYFYLSSVQKPTDVLLFSANPYVAELFQHHPNRKNMRLHTIDMYPELRNVFFAKKDWGEEKKAEFKKNFLREQFGDTYFIRRHSQLPSGAKQIFYPGEEERVFLKQEGRYAVIQPFSSSAEKDMPLNALFYIVDVLVRANIKVFLVVRKNIRTLKKMNDFDPEHYLQREIISKINFPERISILKFSVPAVIQLIEKADFFAGSDSAFVKAAWYYNRPNLFLLPDFLAERPKSREKIQARAGNYSGIGHPMTHFKIFSDFCEEEANAFMKQQGIL